LYSRWSN
jgi:hypothetical protein